VSEVDEKKVKELYGGGDWHTPDPQTLNPKP